MATANPRTPPKLNANANKRHPDHETVHINSLRLNSLVPIRLFTEIDGELIVYRRENMPFTKTQRLALLQNDIEFLYIPTASLSEYWDYLRKSISYLVDSDSEATEEKAENFYKSVSVLTKKIYEDELTPENLVHANNIVKQNVGFIERESALHMLMPNMSASPTLETHSLNVCQYGIALAKELGLTDHQELHDIGLGLMLQDLGMLELNQELLFRATPLSFEEFNEIKQHPSIGVSKCTEIKDFPQTALDIILQHHERIDGSGYPQQLTSPEMCLGAKISGIVDTFAALTTEKPYREAKTSFEALKIMSKDIGKLFDPQIFQSFVRTLNSLS